MSENEMDVNKKKGLNMQKLLAPMALVIIYAFFALFGRNFFSYTTLVNILDSSYYIGFLAIGVTFAIITAGIDLSCGTVMMCAAIIGGTAYKTWGWPMGASLLLIILVGTLFGLFNGVLISRLGLPPFIATMGTMMISRGTGSIVSNVRSATFPPRGSEDAWFKNIFKYITPKNNINIPTGAIVLLLTAFIAYIILTKTKMGRYIFAIGSNKEAARLSGVNVQKWEMLAYVVGGVCAGIGGIAFASVYTTVMPDQGAGFELFAIAGAVIGGTSLAGGSGSILGTMIGVYIMSVLRSGLPSMNLQAQWQTFFTGVVVILAVLLDMYRTKKSSEVHILKSSEEYRESQKKIIAELKNKMEKAEDDEKAQINQQITLVSKETRKTYISMAHKERKEKTEMKKKTKKLIEKQKNALK